MATHFCSRKVSLMIDISGGMVAKFTGVSQTQRATFDGYVREWNEQTHEPGPIGAADRPQVVQAIRACYTAAGLAWHDNVVWVGSPCAGERVAELAAAGCHLARHPSLRRAPKTAPAMGLPNPGRSRSRIRSERAQVAHGDLLGDRRLVRAACSPRAHCSPWASSAFAAGMRLPASSTRSLSSMLATFARSSPCEWRSCRAGKAKLASVHPHRRS